VKIIFLDFDGVLLTPAYQLEHGGGKLEPEKVALLYGLLRETGARVVVSSNWRGYSVGYVRRPLAAAGLRNAAKWVIGQTARFRSGMTNYTPRWPDRGDEIQAWLNKHPDVERFVILDDDDDMGPLLPHLVRTETRIGLTTGDVRKAGAMLAGSEVS
jgi:hypothetical protein